MYSSQSDSVKISEAVVAAPELVTTSNAAPKSPENREYPQGPRLLSNTNSECLLPPNNASLTNRRRAESALNSSHYPQHIDLPPARSLDQDWSCDQETLINSSIEGLQQDPLLSPIRSQPIAIPISQPIQRPTTPLTGRPQSGCFFRHPKSDSSFTQDLTPNSISKAHASRKGPIGLTSISQRISRPASQSTSRQPPFSTSRPQSSPSSYDHRKSGNQYQAFTSDLGKFHPLNFPNSQQNEGPPSVQDQNMLSGFNARPNNSHSRECNESDSRQMLQQFQRRVVKSATQASHALSHSLKSPVGRLMPASGRLEPVESPGGSVTPFALESKGDYLLAGTQNSQVSPKANGRRTMNKLVEKENSRRQYPSPRAGSIPSSPAVSPTGGP